MQSKGGGIRHLTVVGGKIAVNRRRR